MNRKEHWESIYQSKPTDSVSWYQKEPTLSLELIANTGIDKSDAIIDVGGGASVLVDHLLQQGYENISVLDIAAAALECAKTRLGKRAAEVNWLESDITAFTAQQQYRVWHDRAVFHFLTNESDRQKYIDVLNQSTTEDAQLIIAAFAIGGPNKCSGLDIVQYDAAKLATLLGQRFTLMEERTELHLTPSGLEQQFGFYRFRKTKQF